MMSGGFEKLSLKNRDAIWFSVTPSLGVIRSLLSLAMGKQLCLAGNNTNTTTNNIYIIMKLFYFEWNKPSSAFFFRFCAGDIDGYMDIFLDIRATKDAVIKAGTAIFLYMYHGAGTTLGEVRYSNFSRKAAAGMIKLETLPPTEGAAAQHSLRAYLQTRDWLLLKSMSLDPSDYGWTVGVHGYEPVPTLDPMAPEELLQFISCNCHGDCSSRRCSCKKNHVKSISACRVCQGITCKNAIHDEGIEDEYTDTDS